MPTKPRLHLIPSVLSLALLAGGCATGSSASFTMAPLFFSELANADGEIVATSDTPGRNATLVPYRPLDEGVETYVAASGNAVLPVNAVLPPAPLIVLTGGSAPIGPLLGGNGAVNGIALSPLGPVTLGGTLAGLGPAITSLAGAPVQLAANATAPVAGALAAAAAPVSSLAATGIGIVAAAASPTVSAVAGVAAPAVSTVTPAVAAVAAAVAPTVASVTAPAASIAAAAAGPAVPMVSSVVAAVAPAVAPVTAAVAPVTASVAPIAAPVQQVASNIAAPVAQATLSAAAPALITAAPLLPVATKPAPATAPTPALLTTAATALGQTCVLGMCR